MLEDFRQTSISKTIIKFIDIILDLYSPVPYEIRNQMRILQSTLLYGRSTQLEEHISHLQQKLQLKQKYRLAQNTAIQPIIIKKSNIKTARNNLTDSNKQNNCNFDNQRAYTCQNDNKFDTINYLKQPQRTRKVSAIEFNKSFDDEESKKNYISKQGHQNSRSSSRTLLKIVKKNKSTNQKLSVTQRSSTQSLSSESLQTLKFNSQQILNIMNSNQIFFNFPSQISETEGWKIPYEGF